MFEKNILAIYVEIIFQRLTWVLHSCKNFYQKYYQILFCKISNEIRQEVFATLSVKWNLIQKQDREKCGRGGEGEEGGYSGYIKGKMFSETVIWNFCSITFLFHMNKTKMVFLYVWERGEVDGYINILRMKYKTWFDTHFCINSRLKQNSTQRIST